MNFHAVLIAGVRNADRLAAFYAGVTSELRRWGDAERGSIKLAVRTQRNASERARKASAYVAGRACR